MSAEGYQKVGTHVLLRGFVHGVEQLVDASYGLSWYGAVAEVLREPCKLLAEKARILLVEQINHVHLSCHNETLLVLVEPVYQRLEVFLVFVETLITLYDTRHGQFGDRLVEQRLTHRHVDVHRSAAVVRGLEYGFVDEAVAVPLILFGLDVGQVHRHLHQRSEDT